MFLAGHEAVFCRPARRGGRNDSREKAKQASAGASLRASRAAGTTTRCCWAGLAVAISTRPAMVDAGLRRGGRRLGVVGSCAGRSAGNTSARGWQVLLCGRPFLLAARSAPQRPRRPSPGPRTYAEEEPDVSSSRLQRNQTSWRATRRANVVPLFRAPRHPRRSSGCRSASPAGC